LNDHETRADTDMFISRTRRGSQTPRPRCPNFPLQPAQVTPQALGLLRRTPPQSKKNAANGRRVGRLGRMSSLLLVLPTSTRSLPRTAPRHGGIARWPRRCQDNSGLAPRSASAALMGNRGTTGSSQDPRQDDDRINRARKEKGRSVDRGDYKSLATATRVGHGLNRPACEAPWQARAAVQKRGVGKSVLAATFCRKQGCCQSAERQRLRS
jgi:hypothetical protein